MGGHADGGDSPRACHLVCQPSRNRADPGNFSLLKTEAEYFFFKSIRLERSSAVVVAGKFSDDY